MILIILITFLLSVFITWLLIPRIIRFAFKKRLFDKPDERKIHHGAVPRLGGVTFFPVSVFSIAAVVSVITLFAPSSSMAFWNSGSWIATHWTKLVLAFCAAMILYVFGVADDLTGVRYRNKFISQIVAGLLMCMSGLWLDNLHGIAGLHELNQYLGWPITIFAVVFITNAINFIDGIDGLASGLCSIGLLYYGTLLAIGGKAGYSLLAFAVLGAVLAFMWFNLHGTAEKKNKIFMGDTGSLFLGLLLSGLGVSLNRVADGNTLGCNAFAVAFAPLIVPCFDVLRVVLHRVRHKKSPFKPDKNHLHHKFMALGFTQRQVLVIILLMSVGMIVFSNTMSIVLDVNLLLIVDMIVWMTLNYLICGKIKKLKK